MVKFVRIISQPVRSKHRVLDPANLHPHIPAQSVGIMQKFCPVQGGGGMTYIHEQNTAQLLIRIINGFYNPLCGLEMHPVYRVRCIGLVLVHVHA